MVSENILSGNIDALKKVKLDLEQGKRLKEQQENLSIEKQRMQKNISAEEKLLNDTIENTIKKRRDDIASGFDHEIEKEQQKLKVVKSKREKAKNKGIAGRIDAETSSLKEENKLLKSETKSLLKQNKAPSICNNKFYYSLYLTKGFDEILILGITILIAFLGIPILVSLFLPDNTPLIILVYFGIVVLFFSLYHVIKRFTKVNHIEVLKEVRVKRDQTARNKRKIKSIKKRIVKDKNEKQYNLEDYDIEIANIEEEISNSIQRKKDALMEFEQKIKPVIIDEIRKKEKERMEQLKEEESRLLEQLKETEKKLKENTVLVTTYYEPYLGKEYSSIDSISQLIETMKEQSIATVSEAIHYNKNQTNKE